jgi:hypothetical protein
MAKKQTPTSTKTFTNPRKKRPGVHSKKKSSKLKSSRNYLKRSVGQG